MQKIFKFLILFFIIDKVVLFSLNSREFTFKSKNLKDGKIKMDIELKGKLNNLIFKSIKKTDVFVLRAT